MLQTFESLYDLLDTFPDEQSCIDHLRAIRWRDGAFCPHCGSLKVYHFADRRNHKCGDCRARFSIKVGTIFEDSKLPLRKWFMAIWMITSHTKGITSTQLAKDLKITQKSAWFVLHRLRHAARTDSFNEPLSGEVEIDETAIGGKEKNKHARKKLKQGRGSVGKVMVMGMIERNGEIRAGVVSDTRAVTLQAVVREHVAPGSTIYTDEHGGYLGLSSDYTHVRVRHSKGEYVRGSASTNAMEGVWALLKRQIVGIHHFVSPKHLERYVTEMTYRYNRRDMGEGERMNALLGQVGGRLRYAELIA